MSSSSNKRVKLSKYSPSAANPYVNNELEFSINKTELEPKTLVEAEVHLFAEESASRYEQL